MDLLAENAVHPDRAVIVVTHDNRVFHYADAIAHMDDGRIVENHSRSAGERLATQRTNVFA
jgi:putative ABC transport system ATP-binding protein